ncbi:hypothetical protein ACFV8Z_22500 [Streptomyces sp. NPDC059837]|uniref:hypothetical protein n=1 Tax=Streptomyces sp. NPDC059837 TaxID=3346968 RepID=UPI003668E6DF
MTFKQPDFWVLEYITITKDPAPTWSSPSAAPKRRRTSSSNRRLPRRRSPARGRGGDLGRDLGDLTAGLGGSDSLGEMGEVAQSRVVVAVRRGQRVQGGVEVDACAGA